MTVAFALALLLQLGAPTADQSASTPDVLIVCPDDAPVAVAETLLVRSSLGVPASVDITLRDRGVAAVSDVRIRVLLFDRRYKLKRQTVVTLHRPVPVGGLVTTRAQIFDAFSQPEWRVVVAVDRVDVGGARWEIDDAEVRAKVWPDGAGSQGRRW